MPQLLRFRVRWRFLRRVCQLAFLVAFLLLFRGTELGREGALPYANLAFRLDPLIAASAMLAAKTFIATLALSLIVVVLTAVLGRVFCGWICPLGTLLDGAGKTVRLGARPQRGAPRRWWRPVRHVLLIAILVAAALGLPLVGYLDPFAILTRGLTVAVDPVISRGADAGFTWLYLHAPEVVTNVSEPIYGFLREHVLAFEQAVFQGVAVSAGILLTVFLLERVERRFWCRNLCPLGAMLSVIARVSPLRRRPGGVCGGCLACAESCRMDAFTTDRQLEMSSCTLCMDCVDECPQQIATFTFRRRGGGSGEAAPTDLSRRVFVTGCTVGLALPGVVWAGRRVVGGKRVAALRPPGAADGGAFLDLCVRCGECLKVCPTSALQPAGVEGGIDGFFAPRLVPRIGYCEYNCTLCGEVCPTGAIAKLPLEDKQQARIGLAVFDETRCLPFATGESCIVCEEHCPVPEKAIRTKPAEIAGDNGEVMTILQPYVVEDLCIGCGICENKCPVEGKAGVRIRPL